MKKKILLIDDDSTYIYILKQLLKKHDGEGEIVTAGNGSKALEILKIDYEMDELPEIIISDIEMPIMSGIIFTQELEKLKLLDYTLTKVILNSNNSRYAELDWSVGIPAIIYFQKPLLNKHLLTILGE
ncbi:CheY-like chemotaxis protein [Pontibacter aydingkolensis]|uniref:Response regulator n=1 Tax=Pontibacter aydingkolensis TaxID=1911536 RepID=A0ABS7CZN2_9BACT|nr:response regulator [Pontibacter aydingkolensis]MBW7469280.1 response regulator [Pontibacter aydingkolensis]